jgi:hypothetical protein
MRTVRGLGFLLLALMFAPVNVLYAQSITITPANASAGVGQIVQFAAEVSDLSRTGLTWSVAGVKGGNHKVGTITSAGRYKAPAKLPRQNPVKIKAASKAHPHISATTYVYILASGPRITAVSPNPLQVGTFTTIINGSGFQAGAVVLDTADGLTVHLVTLSVTPTTVTATGYQGPAASASFSVENPGSLVSNSITVPVASTVTAYTLNVVNGTGSGAYAAGSVVTINANAAPSGQSFLNWTGAAVSSPNQASTTLTMPAATTTVTANYSGPAAQIPYPVSTHPRLWVTTNDLPRLQS